MNFKGGIMIYQERLYNFQRQAFLRVSSWIFLVSALILSGLPNGFVSAQTSGEDLMKQITEGVVDNNGVQIHYASLGEGPLVILIHGHPDFWYGWRYQMPALASKYHVVAIDQRGFNLSSQPKGVENYSIQTLVSDVAAVIKHFKQEKAILVGHDTGAAIAYAFATALPQMTEKIIVLNLPHPTALAQARATNPEQQAASQTSLSLAQPGSVAAISTERLLAIVNPKTDEDRAIYTEAFGRTSPESFVAYFQARFGSGVAKTSTPLPNIQVPTLQIHGLDDPFILPVGYDQNWQYIDNTLTTVMIPNAGHFVQVDAAEEVTKVIMRWLSYLPYVHQHSTRAF
jgi:epoxide hydrolase 4